MNEATVRALIRRFAAAGLADGDYGDISISGGVWTIDAGTVTFAKVDPAAIVTEAEGIASNDNDTTIPTSAAVKAYADSVGRVLLATRTASASATLDFTEFNNAVYRRYEFELENLLPATDDVALLFRTSTNGGSSYDSAGGDYQWSVNGMNGAVAASSGSGSAGSVVLTGNTAGARPGNAAGEYGVTGIVQMFNAGSTASPTDVQGRISFMNTSTAYSHYSVAGVRVAAADVDACRFQFNGANATSGTIRMFGIV